MVARKRTKVVVWSQEERRRVADRAAELWREAGLTPGQELQFIRKAQSEVLSKDRQRPPISLRQRDDGKNLFPLIAEALSRETPVLPGEPSEPDVLEAADEPEALAPVETDAEVEPEAPVPPPAPASAPKLRVSVRGFPEADSLRLLVELEPGLTTEEIARRFNTDPTKTSAALSALVKNKSLPLDRIPGRNSNKRATNRWYLPRDLPEDERVRRAEIAAMIQASKDKAAAAKQQSELALPEEPVVEAEPEDSLPVEPEMTAPEPVTAPAAEPEVVPEPERSESAATPDFAERLSPFFNFGTTEPKVRRDMNALVADLAQRMAAQVAQALQEQILDTICELVDSLPPVTKTTVSVPELVERVSEARRPRFMVIGLLPIQAGEIQSAFGEVFDLRFFGNDEAPKSLHDKLTHVDRVFLMTGKVSHTHQEIVKKSKRPFTFVNGLTSGLREVLNTFLIVGSAKA